jgi:hypothetical protein
MKFESTTHCRRKITSCLSLLLLLAAGMLPPASRAQAVWSRPEFANGTLTTNIQANWAWFSRLYDNADMVLEYYCQIYNNCQDCYAPSVS